MIDWAEIQDLHREATWGGLSESDRAELHRRIGELLSDGGGVEWVDDMMRKQRDALQRLRECGCDQ